MKTFSKQLTVLASSVLLAALAGSTAFADDGERIVRSVSSSPGTVADPEPEGEHAFIKLMNFHVPAQLASGELTTIVYNNIDDVLVKEEVIAKPLISVYVYGPVIAFDNIEASGFVGHGRRDAFGAISLDDGETWKPTNLSNSADQSSFAVSTPLVDPGFPAQADTDGDGVADSQDNCVDVANADQRDTDGDGYGNICDADLNGDGTVDLSDFSLFRSVFNTADPDADFNGDGTVDLSDFSLFRIMLASEVSPGPSCIDSGDCSDPALITDYPGDAINVFHAVAGNRVMAAWPSRFCTGGSPVFGDTFPRDEVATYLGIDNLTDLYLTDMFSVGGDQGSVTYVDNEPVGEVPYSCLWSARGVLRENPEVAGTTELVWFQAERLTSGRRDVNRVETKCVAGAGCAITWQEDPEGTNPGEGEGPGTGWAGATTNSKTDIWYSFVEWEDFDLIDDGTGTIVPLADNILDTGRPLPYVPMMSAVRLTNNDRCAFPVDGDANYCEDLVAAPYGIKNQCIDSVDVPLGPNNTLQPICVVDANGDGAAGVGDMPNLANTAASRPRLNMQPRDSDGDGIVDDAWVVIVSEEDKGLGSYGFINTEEWTLDNLADTAQEMCEDPPQQPDEVTGCQKADVGKNVFWASFNLGSPNTSAGVDVDYSLIENLLYQGSQLNQPEVNWRTGVYYPPMDTTDMWDFGAYNYLIFNTEIARRTSMMSQSVAKATALGTQDGLVAMPLWKQGIVNQGGPADISTRRIVAPANVDPTTENPYAASNMVCAFYDGEGIEQPGVMYFTEGENPYYPDGLCMAAPINLSARTPYECEVSGISDGVCPGAADMTCVDYATFGQLCLSTTNPEDNQVFDKLVTWYECPGWNGTNVSGDAVMQAGACGTEPDSALLQGNLDDQSWYMPLEVSKAHRGFLDGNHVMMIYAWSPNWKLNAVGSDRYELYTRRSFDAGVTWTTTPGSFTASDGLAYSGAGTTTCETMRDGASVDTTHVCTVYAAGDPEQSRNVSQHKSMKITTLDPRYTPTVAGMATEAPADNVWGLFTPIDPTDIRNPSRNFVVFESGDNTTVAVGEAEPLNLDYGRAELFGDHFTVWSEIDTGVSDPIADCYPSNAHDTTDVDWAAGTGFCNEFDTLEGFQDSLSEEASVTASAYGDFLYGVWGQFNVDLDNDHEFIDGDVMFRRVWYLDDYISTDNAYTLPGVPTAP